MQAMSIAGRGGAVVVALLAATACGNEIPTVVGESGFPSDQVPATVDLLLPAASFIVQDTVFDGYQSLSDARYLLVANQFDGALTSNVLARFTGFPDSIAFFAGGAPRTDRNFTYGPGRIVAVVDTADSRPTQPTTLQLLSLTQSWDSAAVSWMNAIDRPGSRLPWREPGGTTGDLLSEATWVPGDTIRKDSLVWSVDSLTVQRLARGELPGVLVRSASAGSRLEISRLLLEVTARPASRPDTAVTIRVTDGPQTFVFTPEAPAGRGVLRIGGLGSARTVLRLDLSQTVPSCRPPQTCRQVPLREVTLDLASLLLDPLPVPSGFRPVGRTQLSTRRLLEPELGSLAPLGEILADQFISPDAFARAGEAPIAIILTGAVRAAIASSSPTVDVALLGDLGTTTFGSAWFGRSPRLRLLYTVPARPRLP